MTKEELQAAYFSFYDQLNEPERSQAKENWDYEYPDICVPKTLICAFETGLDWDKTNESFDYWNDMHRLISTGAYHVSSKTYQVAGLTISINNLTDKEVTAYMRKTMPCATLNKSTLIGLIATSSNSSRFFQKR